MIAAKFTIIFTFLTFHNLKTNPNWPKETKTKQSAPCPLQYLNYRYRQEPFYFEQKRPTKRLNELIEHLNCFLAFLFVALACRVFKKAFSASF